ncbi:MAG: hypothetical protein AAGA97_00140 [Pseudomonadota bacterium]
MRTFDPVVRGYDGSQKMAETLARSSGAQLAAIGLLSLSRRRIVEMSVGRGAGMSSITETGAMRSVSRVLTASLSLDQADPVPDILTARTGPESQNPIWVNSRHHLIGISTQDGDFAAFAALVCERARTADTPERRKMIELGLTYVDQLLHERIELASTTVLPDLILRSLSFGFAVVEPSGAIAYIKDNAEEWLQDFEELQLSNHRLSARSVRYQTQLQGALAGATGSELSPSVLTFETGDGPPKTLVVLPMPDGRGQALLIFGRDHEDRSLRNLVFDSFGLTRAERRLALLLLSGKNLQAAAQEANLTISTARSYLKRIFAKTGINRQSQLVTLYYKMMPSIRSLSPPQDVDPCPQSPEPHLK